MIGTTHLPVIILACSACASAIVGPGNATKHLQKTDTYLDAYSKSRVEAERAKQGVVIITAKDGEKKLLDRDDSYNSGYDYAPPFSSDSSFSSTGSSGFSGSSSYSPSSSYGSPVKFEPEITYSAPPNTYGPPSAVSNSYGPPSNTYGPPSHTYRPPASAFGPPAQTYGPPIHRPVPPVYGPPIQPSYGVPYTAPALGFLDKLSLKLDILTIAKLLLKFFIFKKLVTMLAVVCMLLVIPKLISFKKDKNTDNNEEEERASGRAGAVELTSVQQLLERAVSVYGQQQADCGVVCRVHRVIDDVYQFQPYLRRGAP